MIQYPYFLLIRPKVIYILIFISAIPFGTLSCSHGKKKTEIIKSGYLLQANFTLSKLALQDIDAIEKKNNGVRMYARYIISLSNDYFPGAGNYQYGQPLLYIRDTATVRTSVSYFYSVPDSTVRLIEYSWDAYQRDDHEIADLFAYAKKQITDTLQLTGAATTEQKEDWSEDWTVWQKDSVYVRQFMLIEGVPPTPSRTRVLVSWQ